MTKRKKAQGKTTQEPHGLVGHGHNSLPDQVAIQQGPSAGIDPNLVALLEAGVYPPDSEEYTIDARALADAASRPQERIPHPREFTRPLPISAVTLAARVKERQTFLDKAAIAIFGSRLPAKDCYPEAEKLWEAREKWLAGKVAQ